MTDWSKFFSILKIDVLISCANNNLVRKWDNPLIVKATRKKLM